MPKQWSEAIISPIYKKVDKIKLQNYRGVALVAYKILAVLIKKGQQRRRWKKWQGNTRLDSEGAEVSRTNTYHIKRHAERKLRIIVES